MRSGATGLERRMARSYRTLTYPALAVYALGTLLPIVLGFYFSLTDWNGLTAERSFIGFANYGAILRESRFWGALRFTTLFVLSNTAVQNVCALGFALMLDRSLRFRDLYRTILFAPCLLSPIIVGFLWSQLLGKIYPDFVNNLFGLSWDLRLLEKPSTVLAGLVLINNWQWIGYWMLVYLAALQSVPAELYESATLEGAGAVRRFASITLPMIMPAVTVCVVSISLGGFQVYDIIVTATAGGPGHSSESFIMYIYKTAFANERAAFASANSMVYVLFLLVVALVQIRLLRRREVQL